MFNKWKDYLDESIELYPIEMSGREKDTVNRFTKV
jgi:surfactin synthase thioesterase subunit